MPIMRNAPTPRGANPRQVTAAVILRLPTPRHDVLLSSAAVGGYAIERDRGLLPGKRDEGAARFPVTVGVGDRIRSTT